MRNRSLLLCVLLIWFGGCADPTGSVERAESVVGNTKSDAKQETSPSVNGDSGEGLSVPDPVGQQVVVIINSPSGQSFQLIEDVPSGTSLENVMLQVSDVQITGSGETAFVRQIGEVETGFREGWTYEVDGEFANVGIGQYNLEPPTVVSWSYGQMRSE